MPDLRALTLDMPGLSPGEAIAETFRASEGLSQLFDYQLEFYSTDADLQASDFLGKSGTVTLDFGDYTRPFNGIARRFTAAGLDERGYRTYRLELVPSFWLLTRRSNSRIFENQTTKDIIETVLGQGGFPFELEIKGARPTGRQRVYCVQYRETDFNFVCRLMEEEGIFYFFRQADGQHTMVVSDSTSIYEDCGQPELAYTEGNTVDADVTQWYHGYEFITGKWTQNDYNFETPRTNLLTTTSTRLNLPNATSYELYDYPGTYDKKPSDGESLTTTRIEGEEAGYELVQAGSVNATLVPAGKFEMAKHPIDSEAGKSYAVVSVNHNAWWHRETQGGAATGYSAQIVSLPSSVPYRPPRIAPKPMIHGLQTAVVTGPDGEEIYTDEYGRIQVLFFWDRDQKASCWIRVAQSISGKQWGDFYLPRIGQEVVVSFLEGDPDRPLVTGSVYNADNMPPFPLPDNKTQTGYKTHSTLKGGDDNFNELRFEDKKGQEEIYIQAEKDYNRYVKHDDSLKVDHDQTIEIKNDRTETVKEGNEKVTIEKGDRTHEVSEGDEKLTVGKGDRTVNVDKGDNTLNVGEGDRKVNVSQGDDSLTVSMGDHKITVSMGGSTITAMESITLQVGSNSIKIEQSGITIQGMMVTIQGDATVDITGGMVTINS
jgi:type VI secretion system secreted protein VgrG